MSRLFPNPPHKWSQEKYRIIEWQAEKDKRRNQKPEEIKLTKEDFMRKWNQERKEESKNEETGNTENH